jgi:hypothetical protein
MSWQARLPPAVNDLLRRLAVDPAECMRADGRFTIEVADCGAIDLIPASAQRLILDAVIAPVDPDIDLRRKQVEKVLKFAASRMLSHPETATLSEDGAMFHLQSALEPGMSPVAIEDAMSDYLNAVMRWRVMLGTSTTIFLPNTLPKGTHGLP